MPQLNISQTTASNLTDNVEDVVVDSKAIDSPRDQDETFYMNSNFNQQWGYFNSIPDLKSAIIMKAIWNVGKGYSCDTQTKVILEHISGMGKDTFDDIMFNMEVLKRVGGDAYAEIIRDDDGTLLNLKVLNPATIRIVFDRKGIIKRYEQIDKIKKAVQTFKPEEILHLCHNRMADQMHGISDIDAIEQTILADNESFTDIKKIMHRQARPMIMFKLGTDDQAKIDAFIAKMDAAVNKGENVYIPDDENAVKWEVVKVDVSSMVLEWQNSIRNKFYRVIGLPQIVPGAGGQSTESESKVIYLAFEQIVEKEQRYLEKQLWNQLYIKINFLPPTSLSAELQADQAKEGVMAGLAPQPSDLQAGVGR